MVNTLFTALALIAAGQAGTASANEAGVSDVRNESAVEAWRRSFPARGARRRTAAEASADRASPPR